MWLKVILMLIGLTGWGVALPNPPLVTKEGPKMLNDPIVNPLIANPSKTYRLPNDSIPLQYDLLLRTDIHAGVFNFYGRTRIQVKIIQDTNEIVLHSKQQNVNNVTLFNEDLTRVEAFSLEFEKIESHDFLVINLGLTKRVDNIVWLEVEYTSELRNDGEGFYRGSYLNEQNQTVWYATTQFEITEARHAFPCYDEPGIRAPIKLAIVYKEPYYAIANMPVLSSFSDQLPGYTRTIFQTTPPMQTYLLAFLISDFKYKEATSTRIPQNIYGTPKAIDDGWGDYAASIVGAVVRELEAYIGFEYPLPKLDHAALTTFRHGAMENFGLITYIQSGLLLNPNDDNMRTYRENSIIGLISHETAHQWFGDIISPQWWSYTWLNEGFATLFTNYIPSKIYPERNIMKNFVRNNMPAAMSTDELNSTWSMNHYVEEPTALWTKFNNIGYSKSGCVLRMFQETLTENTFAKGLKYYFEENNMTAANPETLHVALQRAYDEDFLGSDSMNISQLMGTWENQAGYPLVSVRINGNNLEFSQARYPSSINKGEIYAIPLTYSTKTLRNFNTKRGMRWLIGPNLSASFNTIPFIPGDWIILNNQQVGYYRVDYSTELWRAIIAQLNEDFTQIHPINRAVLRDEIYMGWKVFDRVTVTDVLDSLLYFSFENEAISWTKSNQLFTELKLKLTGSEIFTKFNQLIKDLTKPLLSSLGYERISTEHTDITDLRNQLKYWNCLALDGECILKEYQKWFNYNSTGASLSIDYCSAMMLLDTEPFNQILTAITTDLNYPSRGNYINNLACNLKEENLRALLEATIATNNLNTADRFAIMRNVFAKSSLGLKTVMTFIEEKHAEISALNANEFKNLFSQLVQYVYPDSVLNYIRLRDQLSAAGYITADDVTALDATYNQNKNWHDLYYEAIKAWFDGNPEPITTQAPTTQAPTSQAPTTQSPTSTNQPLTSTTIEPTTQAQGASSIVASMSVLVICLVLNFS